MANFNNGPEAAMTAGFQTPNNMLCRKCGKYGMISLAVFVRDADGNNVHALNSIVCLECRKGETRGRLVGIFTGSSVRPDFSCRDAKAPPGGSIQALTNALEKEPTRSWFHVAELTA